LAPRPVPILIGAQTSGNFVAVLGVPVDVIELLPHDLRRVGISEVRDEQVQPAVVSGERGKVVITEEYAQGGVPHVFV
jgi:hypothetical protein